MPGYYALRGADITAVQDCSGCTSEQLGGYWANRAFGSSRRTSRGSPGEITYRPRMGRDTVAAWYRSRRLPYAAPYCGELCLRGVGCLARGPTGLRLG